MGLIDRFIKTEKRSLENPNIPVSANNFLYILGYGDTTAASGVTVNIETAGVLIFIIDYSFMRYCAVGIVGS